MRVIHKALAIAQTQPLQREISLVMHIILLIKISYYSSSRDLYPLQEKYGICSRKTPYLHNLANMEPLRSTCLTILQSTGRIMKKFKVLNTIAFTKSTTTLILF